MKKAKLAWCAVSMLTCGALGISTAQAEVNALDLTVVTNITAGTCNAAVQEGGSTITDVNFQDVYIPEVISQSKVKTFNLNFTGCAATTRAEFTLQPANGSACDNAGAGEAFGNSSVATPKAAAVAVEVWGSATPGSGTQMKCKSKTVFPVTMTNNAASIPLSARLIRETGQTDAAVRAGDFSSQAVFDITYK